MRAILPTIPPVRLDPVDELPDSPWLDHLLAALPELSTLPRDRAIEMAVADLALLDRAFGIIEPGRLPQEVITQLVRQAAQLHVARRLDTPRRAADRFRNWPTVGWRALSDRVNLRRRALSERQAEATRLYEALKPNLRYGWQVPLIPLYARLTPELAEKLGPRLLEMRHADALAAFLDETPH